MGSNRLHSVRSLLTRLGDMWTTESASLPQVIDPMCCIVRLAMISFLEPNTKIAVSNHRVVLYPPTLLQGPLRWISGFERGDCHLLLKPIERAIIMYGKPCSPDVKALLGFAYDGLKRLAETYRGKSSIIVHIIELYAEIIRYRDVKRSRKSDSLDINTLHLSTNSTKTSPIKEECTNDDDTIRRTSPVLSSKGKYCTADIMTIFRKLWTDSEIGAIRGLFEHISVSSAYLDAIDLIITAKEKTLHDAVLKYTDCI